MKVLLIHNYYQLRGGECAVFESEQRMLRAAGHEIVTYTRHNDEITSFGPISRSTLPLRTIWNPETSRALRKLIAREAPDVAHFTNTFPLISPAAYDACSEAGIPIVQSIHNYRWLCPAATFFRDGEVCEECVDHSVLRSVRYGCYRGSRAASAVTATMIAVHRRRTLLNRVDRFIALTDFARTKLASGGFPQEKIVVKPNCVDLEPPPSLPIADRHNAIFVGRLSEEKGLHTLLDAWKQLPESIPLRIAGDGPMRSDLERRIAAEAIGNIELLGPLSRDHLLDTLRHSRVLIFPSVWYEGMPMAIIEAFACGVPPIASHLGGMAEMIDDGHNGALFRAGDANDLCAKVQWAFDHDDALEALGVGARETFEANHRSTQGCERLIEIYTEAIDSKHSS